jgi:pimeloyl-ACP methyl ester carboxylesterase
MPSVRANGIQIDYEVLGEPGARPLVLLRGLGTQRIQWPAAFLDALLEAGHRLVLMDNRDAGLSTHLDDAGRPDLAAVLAALRDGRPPPLAYGLDDMADDTAALLDTLDLSSAHIAGISMGGMIAQAFAIRHGERLRSLISIMSSTGNPALPGPTERAMDALMAPAPTERDAYIAHTVRTGLAFASPGYPTPEAERRAMAGQTYDRAFDPDGVSRQLAAVQAHGDRRPGLRTLDVPTLVIHGKDDPLVPIEGGRDTAAAIPGARLLEIPGMGHDLPTGLARTLAAAISDHTADAESASA